MGGEMANAIRSQGIARVDQLVAKAMLNPEVARALLAKVSGNFSPLTGPGKALIRALKLAAPPATTLANSGPHRHRGPVNALLAA